MRPDINVAANVSTAIVGYSCGGTWTTMLIRFRPLIAITRREPS